MKLKLDSDGHAVLQDGKPVYVKDDGTEVAFDAPGTLVSIARLNGEAKGHRERAEKAEADLKLFAGIDDPAKAREALKTVSNLDAKKLVDAGEIEKVKTEISKAFQVQLDTATATNAALVKELRAEKIGGSFARSKLIAEKLVIPPDLAEAAFGSQFEIDGGRIVAKDRNGNKIYSPSNPGELAGFDEALQILIDNYPGKTQILKASGSSGGGAAGNGSSGAGGKKTLTRAQFDALDPAAKATAAREAVLTE